LDAKKKKRTVAASLSGSQTILWKHYTGKEGEPGGHAPN